MINAALNGFMKVSNRAPAPSKEQKLRRAQSVLALLETELPEDEFQSFINISQPNVIMNAMPDHKAYVISSPLSKTCMIQFVLKGTGFSQDEIIQYLNDEIPPQKRHFKIKVMANHTIGANDLSIHMNCDDEFLPDTIETVMHKLHPLIH